MSGFLPRLSPRHADALRPAAPLRSPAFATTADATPTPGRMADPSPGQVSAEDAAGVRSVDIASPSPAALSASTPALPADPAPPASAASMPPATVAPPGPLADPASGALARQPAAPPHDAGNRSSTGDGPRLQPRGDGVSHAPPASSSLRPPDSNARAPLTSPVDSGPAVHAPPPLSATTVARLEAATTASPPPAIHLHIDRIEVRAAARPATPAPTRARPMPEPQSLQDYLQGKRAR